MKYPPWVVLHIPHDSVRIPPSVREQFTMSDAELDAELERMTDHFTLNLYSDCSSDTAIVYAPVSRLVVDVERFSDDASEPMAARGMGAIYQVTSGLRPLRQVLMQSQRQALLDAYYQPHHVRLEAAVDASIERFGKCLVLDCHSFPAHALPYEFADPSAVRPDICIGTDDYHTDSELARSFIQAFGACGWRVKSNDPFSGAIVPRTRYRKDARVQSIMIEVNRGLYLDADGKGRGPDFNDIAQRIRGACVNAIKTWQSTRTPA